jgi:uncharacterized coiled-coil DUF342 family protein
VSNLTSEINILRDELSTMQQSNASKNDMNGVMKKINDTEKKLRSYQVCNYPSHIVSRCDNIDYIK